MSAAVNVLVMLPKANAVSVCTGVFFFTSVTPAWPVHTLPSAYAIATDRPGMPYFHFA